MQRKNSQKEMEKSIVDNLSKAGDKIGYNCIAPGISFFSGEHMTRNGARALTYCPKYLILNNALEEIAERNPELKSSKADTTLKTLFTEAGSRGMCRFWREHGEAGGQDLECKNSDAAFEKAKNDCYELLSKMELK